MEGQTNRNIVRKAKTSDTRKAPERTVVRNGRTISRTSRSAQTTEADEGTKKVRYRINKVEFGAVMYIAIVIDIIELILAITGVGEVANYALDVGKVVLIPIWMVMKGVSPMKPGRILRLSVMWLVGFIPFVGSFVPELAIGMWATIRHARKEDEQGVK